MEQFRLNSEKYKNFNTENCFEVTLREIFEDLTNKFKRQFELVLGSDFKGIIDFITLASKLSDIYFTPEKKTKLLIEKHVKKSMRLSKTYLLEAQKTIKIEEEESENKSKSGSEIHFSAELDLESEESFKEKTAKPKPRAKPRETKLISNDIFKSSLNPKQEKKLLAQHESMKEEEDLEDESMSFEARDLELEDDVESEEDVDYSEEFNRNKMRFCTLLDQVLFDVNCVNFFDKAHISNISQYFESFK